jgi:DNA-binding NarL/FixJ family response regulator
MENGGSALVGRAAECARIEGLLNAARAGQSEVLIVRGEPGVGKTALVRYALERATQAGLTTISARGLESESEIPFAGLADLIRPVRQALSSIPKTQQSVLAGALALGPPVPGDRFAVCAATLSLLAAAAEIKPLLCVVDDVQWLDASSAEAVLFVGRRVEAEGIGMVIALREGEGATIDLADFPTLRLGGLDEAAATRLLADSQPGIAAEVASQLSAAVGGNPLALLEIPALLSEAELSGAAPLPDPLPAGPNLERAFLRRVRALPAEAQRALVAAAASESGDISPILRALELMRLPAGALDAAESSGLVSIEGAQLRFRHPLVRSAVYEAADPVDRRQAHRALAAALEGEQFADQRAWHLAAAAPAPDENVAAVLERAAERAQLRSGYGAAASALIRAAGLSPSSASRARRLLDGAKALQLAGKPSGALALLNEAASLQPDDSVRSGIEHVRAELEMWVGTPIRAHDRLLVEASRCEASNPTAASILLAEAVFPAWMSSEVSLAMRTAKRAHDLAQRAGEPIPLVVNIVLAGALVLAGQFQEESVLVDESLVQVSALGPTAASYAQFLIATLLTLERYEDARSLLVRVISEAREASAVGMLPHGLGVLCELEFRCGNLAAAYAVGTESVRLANETGSQNVGSYNLVMLARVEAVQGRDKECRRHVAAAFDIARDHGIGATFHLASATLGLLELGRGRLAEACAHLEEVARLDERYGIAEPNLIQWHGDYIEAFARAGRRIEADRALSSLQQHANRSNRLWTRAVAARYRGYLSDGDYAKDFEEALELHRSSRTPSPFEIARTQLCFGEVLRRKRDRIRAREELHAALDTFEQLGAEPWADRARAELSATGERARKRNAPSSRDLTPQELQIALAVAGGATNREAASRLFLSPKTVEAHLSSLYRKLEIRSRTDLARLFASRLAAAVLASMAGLAAHQLLLQEGLLLGALSSPAT